MLDCRRLALACVLLLISPISRLAAQDQRASLLKADRLAAALSSDSGFAIVARRSFDSAGVLLWPQAPVLVGAGQIRLLLSSQKQPIRLTWQPLGLDLSSDSTLGVTWGVTWLAQQAPVTPTGLGRYISVWRRVGDAWSVAALVFIGISAGSSTAVPAGVPLSRPAGRSGDDMAPFIAADQAFARLARDSGAAVAFRTWADEDAVIFGGGGLLIRGREAIGQAVAGPERWDWHPVIAGGARKGDLGWTVGEAIIRSTEAEPSYSKYLTVWKRRGGTSQFIIDGGNGRPRSP